MLTQPHLSGLQFVLAQCGVLLLSSLQARQTIFGRPLSWVLPVSWSHNLDADPSFSRVVLLTFARLKHTCHRIV